MTKLDTSALVAAFLERGGSITKCKPRGKAKPQPARVSNPASDVIDELEILKDYEQRYRALRGFNQPLEPDFWAAQPIDIADPLQALKEAAAVFVIARDEGLESARLYEEALLNIAGQAA